MRMCQSFDTSLHFVWGKMKEVTGTEYYLWGAGFLASLTLSMVLLTKAVQTLPIGTAYPVWTGISAVGIVLRGIVYFLPRKGLFRPDILYCNADSLDYRLENGLTLKITTVCSEKCVVNDSCCHKRRAWRFSKK